MTAIRQQTDHICESKEFRTKKKLGQLLRFLVDETLAGREDGLHGYQIGISVFDRDKDFDPDYDPIVRIQASRLRRSSHHYYPVDGKDDPIRILIPKGEYRPKFYTAEEINDKTAAGKGKAGQIGLYRRRNPGITVLPFRNFTGDPEKEYFVQGFTEELSIELTRYKNLMVIGCLPESYAVEMPGSYQNISGKLGVRFLIEGSLQLDQSRITVLIKLIDGHTNEQVWAERYQRDLSADSLIVNIVYAWKYFVLNEKRRFLEQVNKCLKMKPISPLRKGSLGFHL